VTGPDFSQDTGAIDPRLAAALDAEDDLAIRTMLLEVRLLVPVVAVGEESSGVDMAIPRIMNAAGEAALPVFSSYDALRAWRPDARPVPMIGAQAVSAAIGEGYSAVVLDLAGPRTHVVEFRAPGDQAGPE
jgi:SseB protein N-terminal domain